MKMRLVFARIIAAILCSFRKSRIRRAAPVMRKVVAVSPPLAQDRATRPRMLMDYSVTPILEATGLFAKCGHEITALKAVVACGEEEHQISLDLEGEDQVEYCLDCWTKAIRHCAWCGFPILPGSPITLCYPEEMELSPIDGIPEYEHESGRYVGA